MDCSRLILPVAMMEDKGRMESGRKDCGVFNGEWLLYCAEWMNGALTRVDVYTRAGLGINQGTKLPVSPGY